MTPNIEWKKVAASGIAAVVFTVICLISFFTIDGMSGGFAIAFISFFFGVSSIAVFLLFISRARVFDKILADPHPFAHWTYPEEMAHENVEKEYQDYRERNRIMFMVIGGMLVVVALFFLIFVEDGGPETSFILLAITVLLFAVSRVTPWLERRRAMGAPHEAYITRDGIIYEGSVYPFRSFLVFWHGVSLKTAGKKDTAALIFSFSQLVGRFIIQPFDVVVPVPPGEEEKSVRIIQDLVGNMPEHDLLSVSERERV